MRKSIVVVVVAIAAKKQRRLSGEIRTRETAPRLSLISVAVKIAFCGRALHNTTHAGGSVQIGKPPLFACSMWIEGERVKR